MRLEERGRFDVPASYDETIDYLTDAEAVCRCLPGEISGVDTRDDGGVTVQLTVTHSVASEAVRVRFYVDESDVDRGRVTYTGHGVGSRMKVDLQGEFDVEGTSEGSDIEWWGVADVGGVLSSLNRDIATVAVREKLDETATNVRTRLEQRVAN